MDQKAELQAKLHISGTFECRDADGNLVKTIEVSGEIPLQEDKDDDQRSE